MVTDLLLFVMYYCLRFKKKIQQ